jgi:hypothetical protein
MQDVIVLGRDSMPRSLCWHNLWVPSQAVTPYMTIGLLSFKSYRCWILGRIQQELVTFQATVLILMSQAWMHCHRFVGIQVPPPKLVGDPQTSHPTGAGHFSIYCPYPNVTGLDALSQICWDSSAPLNWLGTLWDPIPQELSVLYSLYVS